MYRGPAPTPPLPPAPPTRHPFDRAWLEAIAFASFMGAWGWRIVGLPSALFFFVFTLVIGSFRTRAFTEWRQRRAIARALAWVEKETARVPAQRTRAARRQGTRPPTPATPASTPT